MDMKLINKITTGLGAITLATLSLVGCKEDYNKNITRETPKQEEAKNYFAEITMGSDSGMAMTSGDFDDDGDLDLIVGAYIIPSDQSSRISFKNRGKLYF
jgi:hypothetical protein